jgi:DNA-binding FrmR family transcriptional regulator
MKMQCETSKKNIASRLKRIEGQVRGIAQMVEEERDCREIMQQFSAIRSALRSANTLFLQEYATGCLGNLDNQKTTQEREEILRDLMEMVSKAI